MLVKDGAKVLDFGLAKIAVGGHAPDAETSVTMSSALSARHTILGTLHYMSPGNRYKVRM
jgi:serine/threonine protein kinase